MKRARFSPRRTLAAFVAGFAAGGALYRGQPHQELGPTAVATSEMGPAISSAASLRETTARVSPFVVREEAWSEPFARDRAANWRRALAEAAGNEGAWQSVLAQIAVADAGLAARYAGEFVREHPALAQIVWAAVLDPLAQAGDYRSAQSVLQLIEEGAVKNHLITNLAMQWGRDDPLAAAEWLGGLSAETERMGAFAQLGRAWAEVAPEEAVEILFRLPAGELRRRAVTEAFVVWTEKAPEAASSWLAQREPQPDLDPAAARIARSPQLVQVDPARAFRWAERIVDPNERTQALGSIVALWVDIDRAAAVRYVQVSPQLTLAQRALLLDDVGSEPERL